MTTRIMVRKVIRLFVLTQIAISALLLISFEVYINVQIAFLSSFFIILGSAYAYKTMVSKQVETDIVSEDRDLLDTIEDPHELYEDHNVEQINTTEDTLELKEIVKQEKKKIKILNLKDIKKGSRAGFSPFRLLPYLFLILSFIALNNNDILSIKIYLPSLLLGIIIGYTATKDIIKISK